MKNKIEGKEKGTIFCIHGNSSSSKVYQKLLDSKDVSYTKIAVDLPGHGSNQLKKESVNDFSFEAYKKYLINKIAEIEDDILLVGNSLGGHLAIEIAPKIKRLKGLVIMGTPPVKKPINFEEAFLPVEALNTFFTENPKEQEIIEVAKVTLVDKTNTSMFINDFKHTNPLVRKASAIEISENKLLNQFDVFTELAIPKYIIAGDFDLSVNREYLESVKNKCLGFCKIIDFENCGHYPSLDKPEEFIASINTIANQVFQ